MLLDHNDGPIEALACHRRRFFGPLVAALLVMWASPVTAHGNLLESVPADGAVVVAPTAIHLEFSTFVVASESTIEIAALNGTKLELGQITRGSSAAELIVPVTDEPAAGRYVVRYDVTGSDGDSIAGGFDFEIVEAGGENPRLTGGAVAAIGFVAAVAAYVLFALRADKKRRPRR